MGKKGKGKDDKEAAEDVFDPLAVETKNVQTAILMLDSPEEDVQSKACEGLYKFANKCDENKKVLLEADAIDGLVRLLSADDRTIRRNALMALSTMTFHADVRKKLRTRDDVVPLFVRLLNAEEFVTTREFATLALCNLGNEFASVATILQHKGLDSLLECLKEDDPDVQKNAAECIALLLQDFEAKSSIKDANGLETLMELLQSEYAIIQQLALQSLIRATQDASNRAALREMDALRVIVNMIGQPEFNDLHVYALHVVANCADDVESLVQLKENGALVRLVAFITDQTPPAEEQKDAKPKGKGKGSAKKKKGEEDKKDTESVPSHTLPEVKMHAARAIGRAARTDEGKRVLHDCDAEKMLVLLLSHEDDKVRVAAASAIAVMGESFVCQEAVVKFDGLDQLVKLTKLENKELKEAGSLAIANLTAGNMPICLSVASANHGIDNLIGCSSNDNERIACNGLTALINMSADDGLRQKILHAGFINSVYHALCSKSQLVQQKAASAVASLICEPTSRGEFRKSRCLPQLVPLLLSNSDAVRRATAWALAVLVVDYDTALMVYQLQGLQILQSINASETKRSKFSEIALSRLLDNNLSLKFALQGELSITDRVPDIFYDAGQLREEAELPTLEQLCAEAVNNKRPVLMINATKPPPPPSPTAADADDNEETRSNSQGDGARTPNSKRQARGETDSPGRTKRAEQAAAAEAAAAAAAAEQQQQQEEEEEAKEFSPPEDPALRLCVENAIELVAQCSNAREELLMLAKLVSDRMGGCIKREQLMSFSYELILSQVKFGLKSNVIPLGLVNAGVHSHRALLFKFLADRVGINCTLHRGSYNRAWNCVWLADSDGNRSYPPSEYVVDLIYEPGCLYRKDSIEAANYKKI